MENSIVGAVSVGKHKFLEATMSGVIPDVFSAKKELDELQSFKMMFESLLK